MLCFADFVMPALVMHISSVCAPKNNITSVKYLAGGSDLA